MTETEVSETLLRITDKLDNLSSEINSIKEQMARENGEIRAQLMAMDLKLDNDFKDLHGNGHPGLLDRMREVEKWVSVHEQQNNGLPARMDELEKKVLVQEKLSQSKMRMIERWVGWAFAIANIVVIAWKC